MTAMRFFFFLLIILSTYSLYSQTTAPILYLPLEASVVDLSENNSVVTTGGTINYDVGPCRYGLIIGDNPNDVVRLDGAIFDGLGDFSISFLTKLDGLNSNNNFLSCANAIQSNEFLIGYNSLPDDFEDGWHLRIDNTRFYLPANTVMDDLDWHHVVIIRAGNSGRLYIDGEKIGEDVYLDDKILDIATNGAVLGQDQDCLGGCFQMDQSWHGIIDELKVYPIALAEDELSDLACSDITSTTTIAKQPIVVYPTIFRHSVRISADDQQLESYKLFDSNGRFIESGKIDGQQTIVFDQLQGTGVFYLQLFEKDQPVENIHLFKIIRVTPRV